MFGLFKSAEKGPKVIDKVWMSTTAKLNACREMLKVNPSVIFIAWFEGTRDELVRDLDLPLQNNTALMAGTVSGDQLRDRIIAFVEHYPLRAKEEQTFKRLMLTEVNVLSSLDEPFFAQFGGEKTIVTMQRLGMKEDEVIGHSMINRAIKNAQDKIGKKVGMEKVTSSQEEWYRLNIGNGL
jgi:hypothetical protein